MEFVATPGTAPSFEGCRLILPAVTVANVGQLTVDLLVSTLALEPVGVIEDECVLPCVGNDPYTTSGTGVMAVAMEVYMSADLKTVVVQQRAPVVVGRQKEHAEGLARWVEACGFSEVVVLAGVDATARPDLQLQQLHEPSGFQFRYLSSGAGGADQRASDMGWNVLEAEVAGSEPFEARRVAPWPLYSLLKAKEGGALCMVLVAVCSEGDNIAEAFSLAAHTDGLCKLLPPAAGAEGAPPWARWKAPASWSSVYGPAPDAAIF